MLEEALQYLNELAVKASTNQLNEITDNGDGTFLVVSRYTGTAKVVDSQSPLFGSVASVVDLGIVASSIKEDEEVVGVFVSKDKAVLQLGDNIRPKDRFTLPLRVNPVVRTLAVGCQNMSHKACVRVLRVDLASVRLYPEDFKTVMSALKFQSENETTSVTRKGDESIAKSVKAKVTGESEIPEELSVTFSVYPDVIPDYLSLVKCSVIIDSMEQLIHIIPLPGELEEALLGAQKHIAGLIAVELAERGVTCPVICGTFCE